MSKNESHVKIKLVKMNGMKYYHAKRNFTYL